MEPGQEVGSVNEPLARGKCQSIMVRVRPGGCVLSNDNFRSRD